VRLIRIFADFLVIIIQKSCILPNTDVSAHVSSISTRAAQQ